MFSPDVMVRLLLALMVTFLPVILMSPLGADKLMPVKALMFTFPKGELMLTFRPSEDMLME